MSPEELFQDQQHGIFANFEKDVRRIHMERCLAYPSGEDLMALARTLCESDGRFPDNIVLGYGGQPCVDGKNTTALIGPVRPLWWHYLSEAGAALRFMKAAKATDKPDTKAVVDFMAEVRNAIGR